MFDMCDMLSRCWFCFFFAFGDSFVFCLWIDADLDLPNTAFKSEIETVADRFSVSLGDAEAEGDAYWSPTSQAVAIFEWSGEDFQSKVYFGF